MAVFAMNSGCSFLAKVLPNGPAVIRWLNQVLTGWRYDMTSVGARYLPSATAKFPKLMTAAATRAAELRCVI
jgi:hypothetical protein